MRFLMAAMLCWISMPGSTVAFASELENCAPLQTGANLSSLQGKPVRAIRVQSEDVFDLEAEKVYWFHHLANRTHKVTKADTILEDVLFKAGDPLDAEALLETERLLRTRRYLRKVEVKATEQCADGSVVVTIHTWDNWSLLPNISLSREGGESKTVLGLAEDNLFGTGNQVNLDYENDSERKSYLLNFRSPNLFGSHWNLNTLYADKTDGESYLLALERPFYRLHAPWAFAFHIETDSENVNEYLRGDEINEYQRKLDLLQLSSGWKIAETGHWVQRLSLGLDRQQLQFSPTALTDFGMPENRDLSQLWLSWQFVGAEYRQLYNVYQFNRVEDINFGWQASVQLGWLQPGLGADHSGWSLKGRLDKAWQLSPTDLLIGQWQAEQLQQAEVNQWLISSYAMWIHQLDKNQSLVGQLTYAHGQDLFRDQRLSLGGDTGMRAYPLYYQTGERLALATAEYRYYSTLSIAQIFDVGYAAFADVGRTWGSNPALPEGTAGQSLYGVGLGIRLLSSHSSRGTMIHIDLTKALHEEGDVSGFEWRILAKRRF
ncbi:BamA/TamA family outer membrane protein [Rheinheimera marina]|uniref:BamA/TamA family outer membrane protein n=1 Tax=Rheinheimera marina TaxID=1774958 RepID=A0ABV9JM05_9GAMM